MSLKYDFKDKIPEDYNYTKKAEKWWDIRTDIPRDFIFDAYDKWYYDNWMREKASPLLEPEATVKQNLATKDLQKDINRALELFTMNPGEFDPGVIEFMRENDFASLEGVGEQMLEDMEGGELDKLLQDGLLEDTQDPAKQLSYNTRDIQSLLKLDESNVSEQKSTVPGRPNAPHTTTAITPGQAPITDTDGAYKPGVISWDLTSEYNPNNEKLPEHAIGWTQNGDPFYGYGMQGYKNRTANRWSKWNKSLKDDMKLALESKHPVIATRITGLTSAMTLAKNTAMSLIDLLQPLGEGLEHGLTSVEMTIEKLAEQHPAREEGEELVRRETARTFAIDTDTAAGALEATMRAQSPMPFWMAEDDMPKEFEAFSWLKSFDAGYQLINTVYAIKPAATMLFSPEGREELGEMWQDSWTAGRAGYTFHANESLEKAVVEKSNLSKLHGKLAAKSLANPWAEMMGQLYADPADLVIGLGGRKVAKALGLMPDLAKSKRAARAVEHVQNFVTGLNRIDDGADEAVAVAKLNKNLDNLVTAQMKYSDNLAMDVEKARKRFGWRIRRGLREELNDTIASLFRISAQTSGNPEDAAKILENMAKIHSAKTEDVKKAFTVLKDHPAFNVLMSEKGQEGGYLLYKMLSNNEGRVVADNIIGLMERIGNASNPARKLFNIVEESIQKAYPDLKDFVKTEEAGLASKLANIVGMPAYAVKKVRKAVFTPLYLMTSFSNLTADIINNHILVLMDEGVGGLSDYFHYTKVENRVLDTIGFMPDYLKTGQALGITKQAEKGIQIKSPLALSFEVQRRMSVRVADKKITQVMDTLNKEGAIIPSVDELVEAGFSDGIAHAVRAALMNNNYKLDAVTEVLDGYRKGLDHLLFRSGAWVEDADAALMRGSGFWDEFVGAMKGETLDDVIVNLNSLREKVVDNVAQYGKIDIPKLENLDGVDDVTKEFLRRLNSDGMDIETATMIATEITAADRISINAKNLIGAIENIRTQLSGKALQAFDEFLSQNDNLRLFKASLGESAYAKKQGAVATAWENTRKVKGLRKKPEGGWRTIWNNLYEGIEPPFKIDTKEDLRDAFWSYARASNDELFRGFRASKKSTASNLLEQTATFLSENNIDVDLKDAQHFGAELNKAYKEAVSHSGSIFYKNLEHNLGTIVRGAILSDDKELAIRAIGARFGFGTISGDGQVRPENILKVVNEATGNEYTSLKQVPFDEALNAFRVSYKKMGLNLGELADLRISHLLGVEPDELSKFGISTIEEASEELSGFLNEYKKAAREAFDLSDEETELVGEIVTARAKTWARLTGKNPSEWADSRLSKVMDIESSRAYIESKMKRILSNLYDKVDDATHVKMYEFIDTIKGKTVAPSKGKKLFREILGVEDLSRTEEKFVDTITRLNNDFKGIFGFHDKRANIIGRMDKDADLFTLLHEMAHSFQLDMEATISDISDPKVRAAYKEGWTEITDWATKGTGKWDRVARERFAEGFTKFLEGGEAETKGIKRIFEKFKEFLVNLVQRYKHLGKDYILPDNIKQLYGEFLDNPLASPGAKDAIRNADIIENLEIDEVMKFLRYNSTSEDFANLENVMNSLSPEEQVEHLGRIIEKIAGQDPTVLEEVGLTIERLQQANLLPSDGSLPSVPRMMADPESQNAYNALFERLINGATEGFSEPAEMRVTDEMAGAMDGWMNRLKGNLAEAKTVAVDYTRQAINWVFPNYTQKYGPDLAMSLLWTYPFWYTRTGAQYMLKAFTTNPLFFSRYQTIKRNLIDARENIPERYRAAIDISKIPGLETENPIWYHMERNMPLEWLTRDRYQDPYKRATWYGRALDKINSMGPSEWVWYDVAAAIAMRQKGIKEQDHRLQEGAARLAGRLLPQSGPLKDLTAMLDWGRNGGGIEVDPFVHYFSEGLDPWQGDDISRQLLAMYEDNDITLEQLVDISREKSGPTWNLAMARASKAAAPSGLLGYFTGAGVRPMTEEDAQTQEFYDHLGYVFNTLDRGDMTSEEQLALWDETRETFPWMDAYLISRKGGIASDRAYAYSIFSRVEPSKLDDVVETVGMEYEQLEKFWDDSGNMKEWGKDERTTFMGQVGQMGAVLAIPDDATQEEWNTAKGLYQEVIGKLEDQYGDNIMDKIDVYYALKTMDDPAKKHQADMLLRRYPEVEEALNTKTRFVLSVPVLSKYYSSNERLLRFFHGQMYDTLEQEFGPKIWDKWDTYFGYKKLCNRGDEEYCLIAKTYKKENPDLEMYTRAKKQLRGQTNEIVGDFADYIPKADTMRARENLPEDMTESQKQLQQLIEEPEKLPSYTFAEWSEVLGDEVAEYAILLSLGHDLPRENLGALESAAKVYDVSIESLVFTVAESYD